MIARNAGLQDVERARRSAERIREAEVGSKRTDLAGAEAQAARRAGGEPLSVARPRAAAQGRRARDAQPSRRRAEDAATSKPITLEFRDAQHPQSVFEVHLAHLGHQLRLRPRRARRPARSRIFVRNTTLDDVLKLILTTNQLERKVLNDNSVLIYPNTPAKQKDYQRAGGAQLLPRQRRREAGRGDDQARMVKTRDVFIDEKLNLLVMQGHAGRGAPGRAAGAHAGPGRARGDARSGGAGGRAHPAAGARRAVSGAAIRHGPAGAPIAATTTRRRSSPDATSSLTVFTVANPALVSQPARSDGTTNILANPRIRVKNREKAKIHIGEKVPVITTTSTANVGRVLLGELPRRRPQARRRAATSTCEDEVAIKVELEVQQHHRAAATVRRHDRLPARHAQHRHHAAAARRRDADAGRA